MRQCRAVSMLAAIWIVCTAFPARAAQPSALTGGATSYTVVAGDTLTSIGARFGVYPATIAAANALEMGQPLKTGQELRIDNRHIVPGALSTTRIVVNVPQRMVFYREGDGVSGYPAAVGRASWQTPTGEFTVIRKETNPAWHVPPSIRAEGARNGHPLPLVVPPGPRNPLGHFWVGLSLSGIGIHGTPLQSSIYQATTHGCLRLQEAPIADFYARVAVGTPGRVLYEPLLLAEADGEVYIEVHPDVYRRQGANAHERARELAARLNLTDRIDWEIADAELNAAAGVARRITLPPPNP